MNEKEHQISAEQAEVKKTKEVSIETLRKIKDAAETGCGANDPRTAKQKCHDIMMLMRDVFENRN